MKKKTVIYNRLAYIILLVLLLGLLPILVAKVSGLGVYGILSNSMEPSYSVGSVVYTKEISANDVKAGDAITFKMGSADKTVATHRVVENNVDGKYFITKGDNNKKQDGNSVAYQRLIGKVVFCLPLYGYVYMWMTSTVGLFICLGLLVVASVLWILVAKEKKKTVAH
ncbi:MAG: signal peptidase I [Vagococcus sp.]